MAYRLRLARIWEYRALKENLDAHVLERTWYQNILERWKPWCPHCHKRTWWDYQRVALGPKIYVGYKCSECGLICAQAPKNKYDSIVLITEQVPVGYSQVFEFYDESPEGESALNYLLVDKDLDSVMRE